VGHLIWSMRMNSTSIRGFFLIIYCIWSVWLCPKVIILSRFHYRSFATFKLFWLTFIFATHGSIKFLSSRCFIMFLTIDLFNNWCFRAKSWWFRSCCNQSRCFSSRTNVATRFYLSLFGPYNFTQIRVSTHLHTVLLD
jgi:hypothetical protein